MATDRDGALLAHIADTVTEMRQEQAAMAATVLRMVETGEAHTEMLGEILRAARQELGPPETAQALQTLTSAVEANTAAVGALAELVGGLPADIGTELAAVLGTETKGGR